MQAHQAQEWTPLLKDIKNNYLENPTSNHETYLSQVLTIRLVSISQVEVTSLQASF